MYQAWGAVLDWRSFYMSGACVMCERVRGGVGNAWLCRRRGYHFECGGFWMGICGLSFGRDGGLEEVG